MVIQNISWNSKLLIGLFLPVVYIIGFIYLWIRDKEFPELGKPFTLRPVAYVGGALFIGIIVLLVMECSKRIL